MGGKERVMKGYHDYIPCKDAEFDAWFANIIGYLDDEGDAMGVPFADRKSFWDSTMNTGTRRMRGRERVILNAKSKAVKTARSNKFCGDG
jgi:hypothetical protein